MQSEYTISKIPKIIHQTYKSSDLPEEIKNIIDELKTINPNWEYRFYTDQDIQQYIQKHYNEKYLYYYNKINPIYGAAKADFFRYLLLYREGGVYLDIKSFCNIPLDDLIKKDDVFFVSQWQNKKGQAVERSGICKELKHIDGGEFQQWYIIAEPNSIFLKTVIENMLYNIEHYAPWRHGVGKKGVLRITGPVMYTLSIAPLLKHNPHRFSRYDYQFGLQYSHLIQHNHETLLPNHYSNFKDPIITSDPLTTKIHKTYIFFYLLYKTKLRISKHQIKNWFHKH